MGGGQEASARQPAPDRDLEAWFHHAIAGNVDVLPLTPEIVAEAMRLPAFPTRDPADELIVATARMHRLVLVTTDRRLRHEAQPSLSPHRRPRVCRTRQPTCSSIDPAPDA
ncbi:MAG: type II toxin-antitoxin system VapC family toxin [Deltaproteobacteria bacterium]|nr:MAG: type II toxin-antitoxin system VapC family toxin [Deltaproteobacteria bacterium]